MASGKVTIDRFRITALAAGDHVEPDRIKAKLDALGGDALGSALARRLGEFGDDDQRLVLMRRLDLGVAESLAFDAASLADRLAGQLAVAIVRLLSASSDQLVMFASRTAFLAAFVRAAVRGEAWDRWWFQRFDGLKFLPLSAAVRTALSEDPEQGLAALVSLAEADRAEAVRALTAMDAGHLLDAFAASEPHVAPLAEALDALAALPLPEAQPSVQHLSLRLLLDAVAGGSTAPVSSLARAADVLALLHRLDPDRRLLTLQALAEGRISALPGVLLTADLARLAPLFAAPSAIRRRVAAAFTDATEPPVRRHTRFGGLILLSTHLPERCGGAPALLALAACAGPANLPEALADELLRDVLNLPTRATADELYAWLDDLGPTDLAELNALGTPPSRADGRWLATPAALRERPQVRAAVQAIANAALRDFARRLPGFPDASAAFLWRNLLNIGARVTETDQGLQATLERPPLDVLLAMSGLADRTVFLPDGRLLQLERAS